MEGHGNNGLDSRPDVLLPAEAPDDEVRQNPGENLVPAVFIEQNDILDDTVVPGRGAMLRERGPVSEAAGADVRLSGPVKETAATKTEGGPRGSQSLETSPANDFLSRLFKKSVANLTGGGKDKELAELSPGGKPPGQAGLQAFSSSFFC
jgi:hypothetical protein